MYRYVATLTGYEWSEESPIPVSFEFTARIWTEGALTAPDVLKVQRYLCAMLNPYQTSTEFTIGQVRWWNPLDWVLYWAAGRGEDVPR